jgi:hypothetical protein
MIRSAGSVSRAWSDHDRSDLRVCGTSNPPARVPHQLQSNLAWDSGPAKPSSAQPPKQSHLACSPGTSNREWSPRSTLAAGNPTGGYPDQAPGDPDYPTQRYADSGFASQACYAAGYDQGAYHQGAYPKVRRAVHKCDCPGCGTINRGLSAVCAHCAHAFLYCGRPVLRLRLSVAGEPGRSVLLGSDPVESSKGAWHSLRQEYVWVKPATVAVVPPKATAEKSGPAALVDESETSGP